MKTAIFAVALAAAAPAVTHSDSILTICIYAFLMGALAVSFNFIFGLTGQLSLFHAAAFGLSAYVSVLLVTRLHWGFWISLILAVLAAVIVAAAVATLCFRFKLREFYFAIVTMALSEILRLWIQNWYELTNGTLGISFVQKPEIWTPYGYITVSSSTSWYFVSLTILVAVSALCWRLQQSWVGRAFSAIRLNEQLAETMGIDVFAYKFLNFVLGSALAGLVGVFYAFYTGFVEPDYLSVTQSLDIVAMVLLGGVNSVAGPILGAFILTALPHVIDMGAEVRVILYGVVLIVVILALPKGLRSLVGRERHAT
jgi:branched-chain amino acid transport system permease protein